MRKYKMRKKAQMRKIRKAQKKALFPTLRKSVKWFK